MAAVARMQAGETLRFTFSRSAIGTLAPMLTVLANRGRPGVPLCAEEARDRSPDRHILPIGWARWRGD
jgi:hypothetical protein